MSKSRWAARLKTLRRVALSMLGIAPSGVMSFASTISPLKVGIPLAGVLTAKRLELLRYVRRHEVASVRALAKALARDYPSVHADVEALTAAGLLDATEGGLCADYDAIETKIAI